RSGNRSPAPSQRLLSRCSPRLPSHRPDPFRVMSEPRACPRRRPWTFPGSGPGTTLPEESRNKHGAVPGPQDHASSSPPGLRTTRCLPLRGLKATRGPPSRVSEQDVQLADLLVDLPVALPATGEDSGVTGAYVLRQAAVGGDGHPPGQDVHRLVGLQGPVGRPRRALPHPDFLIAVGPQGPAR